MYDDLLMFVNLVEIGSFTATAKKYNTSQATISRKIQNLEQQLGLSLINRNSRNFETTDVGMKIFWKLVNCESLITNTLEEVRMDNQEHKVRLRVALPPTLAFHQISQHIGQFLEDNPGISLELFYQKVSVDMVSQNLDLAINTNIPRSQIVKIKMIKTTKLQLYASQKYLQKHGAPQTLAELEQNHVVIGLINPDDSINESNRAYNSKTHESVWVNNNQQRVLTNDALNTFQLVRHGYAIGGAWDDLFFEQLSTGEYVKILPDYTFGELPFYLIRHAGRHSPAIDKFAKFLEACF